MKLLKLYNKYYLLIYSIYFYFLSLGIIYISFIAFYNIYLTIYKEIGAI